MEKQPHPELAEKRDDYDRSTISIKGVAWFVVIFITFAITAHVVVWFIYAGLYHGVGTMDVARSATMEPVTITPTPRIQPSPGNDSMPWQDLEMLRTREYAEFQRRGWVNKETGRVVIPRQIVQQVIALSAASPPSSQRAPAATESGANP